jgi:diadenosine tetraphosphate (Ap4A) HIT family hydrolase
MSDTMTDQCPFCHLETGRVLDQNELAIAFADAFPVSPGHALVAPRRHVADFFELSSKEVMAIFELAFQMRLRSCVQHSPAGFNVGFNVGSAAGQTIAHAHVHVIPRYPGDVPDPTGGIRNVIPGMGRYAQSAAVLQQSGDSIMANASSGVSELEELARAHLLAEKAFNRAYRQFWEAEVTACPQGTGWKLLEVFRREVDRYRIKLDRSERGIEQAAWEIFRLELVGKADYTFKDVVGFVKWYRELKSRIELAIGHLYEFHGDSFADLVDSYPLAGQHLVDRALATHPESDRPRREGYLDEQEICEAVLEKLGPQWHNLICKGGNYVLSVLEAACQKCYLHRVLTSLEE